MGLPRIFNWTRYVGIFIGIFCLGLAVLCLSLLFFYKSPDQITRSYPTLADAQIDIQKRWIPPILPPSTHDIKEAHNLDVNTGAGTFRFDPKEVDFFSQHGMVPRTITDESDAEDKELQASGYLLGSYTEDKTTWLLAVHRSGKGFYWLEYEK